MKRAPTTGRMIASIKHKPSRWLAATGVAVVVAIAGCGSTYGSPEGAQKAGKAPNSRTATTPIPTMSSTAAPRSAAPPGPAAEGEGIPQKNGGDHDSDNNGGPSDGDGNV